MQVVRFLYLATVLWVSAAYAADEPPDFIITTESFKFPSEASAEHVTLSPSDGGMAVEDVPEEVKTEPPILPQSKEEEALALEPQPVLVTFPQNHKNFTPSQYLGDQEFPPYYNHISQYQQQYKNYNEQKQLFSRKPIKFEENYGKNYYLPQGVDPVEEEEKRVQDHRVQRKPFPYNFESENTTVNWYGSTGSGHVLVHEQPNEYATGQGHQESVVPQYVLQYSYPQEQKYYKHEVHDYQGYQEHTDHHDVKKVGNPWKKVFSLLTALVPLGLFLATLTPNVISINSTAPAKTSRQRSEETPSSRLREDVVELLSKYGVESLSEAQCEDKIICELARRGDKTAANPIEKGFWYLANETPWDVAEKAGMNELFKAIKTGNCDLYKCHSRRKQHGKSNFVKKLTRKGKPQGN